LCVFFDKMRIDKIIYKVTFNGLVQSPYQLVNTELSILALINSICKGRSLGDLILENLNHDMKCFFSML